MNPFAFMRGWRTVLAGLAFAVLVGAPLALVWTLLALVQRTVGW